MHVRLFQDYFDKPADQMREGEIGKFLHYLLTEKKNTPSTVNAYNSAMRFSYGETLDIILNLKKLPRIKHNRKIPELPTKDELAYLFYLTKNLRYIISAENGQVTFQYRDYKEQSKEKVMILSADEFIRRFLLHVLPPQFTKIF